MLILHSVELDVYDYYVEICIKCCRSAGIIFGGSL